MASSSLWLIHAVSAKCHRVIREITLCVVIIFSQYRQVKVSGSGRHGLLCCGMDSSGNPGHQLSELSKQARRWVTGLGRLLRIIHTTSMNVCTQKNIITP